MPCLAQSRNYPMLQKSLKPERRFSRLKPTQAKVATKSDSGPITEVTDELSARSCDPPHPYTKNAPTAHKFSDQRCKWTFATVSANSRLIQSHPHRAQAVWRSWRQASSRQRVAQPGLVFAPFPGKSTIDIRRNRQIGSQRQGFAPGLLRSAFLVCGCAASGEPQVMFPMGASLLL